LPAGVNEVGLFEIPSGAWSFDVRGIAGGLEGPPSPSVPAVVGPSAAGHTVTGSASFAGLSPAGSLYAVLMGSGTIVVSHVAAPASPQGFSLTGVPDGTYSYGAFLDLDGDEIMDITDPRSFVNELDVQVTVAGADVVAPALTIPATDASFAVLTQHNISPGMDSYHLRFAIDARRRLPVRAFLRPGPDIPVGVDIPLDQGESRFQRYLELEVPLVGDTYVIDVEYADGVTDTVNVAVTGVLTEAPTPILPAGWPGNDPQPLAPTFSWSAPDPAPGGTFTYRVYIWRPAAFAWFSSPIPSATTSVAYDFDGEASESPLTPATTYNWDMYVVDGSGNAAVRNVQFTTP
jgi:hypothetical protein